MQSLIKRYKYVFQTVELYPDRLDVKGLGGSASIALSNVASVEVGFLPPLIVRTTDGIRHDIALSMKNLRDLKRRLEDLIGR